MARHTYTRSQNSSPRIPFTSRPIRISLSFQASEPPLTLVARMETNQPKRDDVYYYETLVIQASAPKSMRMIQR